jgi:hypothetical protein
MSTRPRRLAATALLMLMTSVCSAQTSLGPDGPWPRWQARFSLGTVAEPSAGLLSPSVWAQAPEARVQSASLYGDYYFSLPSLNAPTALGGFRATSGLLFGAAARGLGAAALPAGPGSNFALGRLSLPAASADAGDRNAAVPYVGLGYTRLSISGGWGFSADIGLVSQNPGGAVRLGGALLGQQSLDEAVRKLRLEPLVQFDVRYSF